MEKTANTYICPACGGDLRFDPVSGKLKCSFCDNYEDAEKMDKDEAEDFNVTDGEDVLGSFRDDNDESIELKKYVCSGCGAEILTDNDTTATFCSFCGRPAMLEDRLEGEKKPAYVIPFKLTRDVAEESYRSWAKRGLLTPGVFVRQSTIEKITGI